MKKMFSVLTLSFSVMLLSACNSSSSDDATGGAISANPEIAAYQASNLIVNTLSGAVSTSINISEVEINVTLSNPSVNCSVSGTVSAPSLSYQDSQTTLVSSLVFNACTETVSVCSAASQNLGIDGTLAITVTSDYNLALGTPAVDSELLITTTGTLTFSSLLTGTCEFNLVTTVDANTFDTSRTADENYQYILDNSTGTICGVDVATLSVDPTEFCANI
jgi:hypothetical protein